MRKKRKLRARAEAEGEHQTDLESPELLEAVEAEAIAVDLEEAADSLEDEVNRRGQLKKILESLLFASEKPLTAKRLSELSRERDVNLVQATLSDLVADYAERGIVVHDVAGGYQFRTHPDSAAWVQQLIAGRPVRLTRAQLEALAIIAYRQPITRPEIDEIRGVDSGGTLKLLLDRNMVRVLGKKEEPGRPLLYGTTRDFLEFFNLAALKDLPTLREYHELTEDSMRLVEEKLGVTAEEAQETAREQKAAADAARVVAEAAAAAEAAGEVVESAADAAQAAAEATEQASAEATEQATAETTEPATAETTEPATAPASAEATEPATGEAAAEKTESEPDSESEPETSATA